MFQNPPDWQEILQYFRGSELQNYFTKILEDDLKVTYSTILIAVLKIQIPFCIYIFYVNNTVWATGHVCVHIKKK